MVLLCKENTIRIKNNSMTKWLQEKKVAQALGRVARHAPDDEVLREGVLLGRGRGHVLRNYSLHSDQTNI